MRPYNAYFVAPLLVNQWTHVKLNSLVPVLLGLSFSSW